LISVLAPASRQPDAAEPGSNSAAKAPLLLLCKFRHAGFSVQISPGFRLRLSPQRE
jgi:hypothetical protein